jgi:hypothetical protein
MYQIYCPECESANPEEAVACSLCGHELQRQKTHVTRGTKRPAHRSWWTRPVTLGAGTLLLVIGVVAGVRFVSSAPAHRKPSAESTTAPTALDAHRVGLTNDAETGKVSERADRAGESPPTVRAVGWIDLIKPKEVIDQTQSERLYHAGKAMTTATGIGVNRTEFHRLLLELGTEVRIAADKVKGSPSKAESDMVESYARAASAYSESEQLWELRQIAEDDGPWLPIHDLAFAESIRARYGVDFRERKTGVPRLDGLDPGKTFYAFPFELPQLIWSKAGEYVAQAERIYLGQPENP